MSDKENLLSKKERIQAEVDRITRILQPIDSNQLATLEPLIQNAAFMRITCEDLQQKIIEDGVVEVYQNGEHQHGLKQSAALQSYNSVIKNLTAVIRAISQYVPPEKRTALMYPENGRTREKTPEEKRREAEEAEERDRQRRAEIDRAAAIQQITRRLEQQTGRKTDWQTVCGWYDDGLTEDEMLQRLVGADPED